MLLRQNKTQLFLLYQSFREQCRNSLLIDPVQNSAAPPKLRNGGQMRSQDVSIT